MKLPVLLIYLCALMPVASGFAETQTDAAQGQIQIDLQAKRTQIRTELLKFAPLGSSSKEVIAFLKSRFLKKEDPEPGIEEHPATGPSAEAAGNRGVKVIRLDLGEYIPNTILLTLSPPMPIQETLIAQWAFDKNDKLVDLFLDRKL